MRPTILLAHPGERRSGTLGARPDMDAFALRTEENEQFQRAPVGRTQPMRQRGIEFRSLTKGQGDVLFTDTEIDEYARTYSRPEVLHGGFELYRTLDQDVVANTAASPITTPTLLMTAAELLGFLD